MSQATKGVVLLTVLLNGKSEGLVSNFEFTMYFSTVLLLVLCTRQEGNPGIGCFNDLSQTEEMH